MPTHFSTPDYLLPSSSVCNIVIEEEEEEEERWVTA